MRKHRHSDDDDYDEIKQCAEDQPTCLVSAFAPRGFALKPWKLDDTQQTSKVEAMEKSHHTQQYRVLLWFILSPRQLTGTRKHSFTHTFTFRADPSTFCAILQSEYTYAHQYGSDKVAHTMVSEHSLCPERRLEG